ncbi:shikimate kinase [Allosphingosinicella sp.]|jgi:shikimate kinase|uniref:shikimate kinase n=1 Tax=Allosphingosinicella sp. TaxID=2823234 RepID=UPI002EF88B6E
MDPPRLRPDRTIVLVGPMGAGKTSVGRRLAERLGLPFADCDEEIERSEEQSIEEIFDRFGEARFRSLERETMGRLVHGSPKVIAAGGGAFIDRGTRALILERCIAIWLDADPATLAERVRAGEGRPLLGGRDPRVALEELARIREPIYAEAHVRIDSSGSPPQTFERVVAAIERRA